MLVSVPAGAIADMFDRRKIAIVGLSFATLCAAVLTALAFNGLTTPWILLAFCSLIGAGVALYSPAWGASIAEQVTPEHLPAAIALGSISYNLARSFGPAVGGVIVLAAGAPAAFLTNSLAYLPLLTAFLLWRRSASRRGFLRSGSIARLSRARATRFTPPRCGPQWCALSLLGWPEQRGQRSCRSLRAIC
jgi:MFS family permease